MKYKGWKEAIVMMKKFFLCFITISLLVGYTGSFAQIVISAHEPNVTDEKIVMITQHVQERVQDAQADANGDKLSIIDVLEKMIDAILTWIEKSIGAVIQEIINRINDLITG